MIPKNIKLYCKDDVSKIENYEEAVSSKEQYDVHHRLEFTINGEYAKSTEELKRLGMYYNRPYYELVLMKHSEHAKLHRPYRNIDYTKHVKKFAGENNPFFGKHHTEEKKNKHSKLLRGKSWKVVNGKRVWFSKEDK